MPRRPARPTHLVVFVGDTGGCSPSNLIISPSTTLRAGMLTPSAVAYPSRTLPRAALRRTPPLTSSPPGGALRGERPLRRRQQAEQQRRSGAPLALRETPSGDALRAPGPGRAGPSSVPGHRPLAPATGNKSPGGGGGGPLIQLTTSHGLASSRGSRSESDLLSRTGPQRTRPASPRPRLRNHFWRLPSASSTVPALRPRRTLFSADARLRNFCGGCTPGRAMARAQPGGGSRRGLGRGGEADELEVLGGASRLHPSQAVPRSGSLDAAALCRRPPQRTLEQAPPHATRCGALRWSSPAPGPSGSTTTSPVRYSALVAVDARSRGISGCRAPLIGGGVEAVAHGAARRINSATTVCPACLSGAAHQHRGTDRRQGRPTLPRSAPGTGSRARTSGRAECFERSVCSELLTHSEW